MEARKRVRDRQRRGGGHVPAMEPGHGGQEERTDRVAGMFAWVYPQWSLAMEARKSMATM